MKIVETSKPDRVVYRSLKICAIVCTRLESLGFDAKFRTVFSEFYESTATEDRSAAIPNNLVPSMSTWNKCVIFAGCRPKT